MGDGEIVFRKLGGGGERYKSDYYFNCWEIGILVFIVLKGIWLRDIMMKGKSGGSVVFWEQSYGRKLLVSLTSR